MEEGYGRFVGHGVESVGNADNATPSSEICGPLQAVRIARPSSVHGSVDAPQAVLEMRNRTLMFAPFPVCCVIAGQMLRVSAQGVLSTRSSNEIFPTSCNAPKVAVCQSFGVRPSSRQSREYFATRPE